MQKELVEIPVGLIKADPDQPRKVFDKEPLDELARSLETNGLLQPISVRENFSYQEGPNPSPEYLIIAGERRYRAALQLGWQTIDAVVIRKSDFRALQLVENLNRANLNPIETARAYQLYMSEGHTVDDLAKVVGVRVAQIAWLIKLLDTTDTVQDLVARSQLQVTTAVEMSKLSVEGQKTVLRTLVGTKLTSTETLLLIERIYAGENQGEMFAEAKLSAEETEARKKAKSAIERACQAIEELNRLETRDPGIIGASLASEIEVTTERFDQLSDGLRAFRASLSVKKVSLVGVA